MLMSIPIISPVEITLGEPGARRLPPPDYEIDALPPAAVLTAGATREPVVVALDEIERAAQVSEYHDFSWWDERIRIIRARLEKNS
jgi:hypothetical protein